MRIDIVGHIWNHVDPEHKLWHYVATQTRPENEWQDHPFGPGERLPSLDLTDRDFYFAPLGFTEQRRSNATAAGLSVLFADVDEADTPLLLGHMPSYFWETSPGRTQAVWLLTDALPSYEEWADLNKRVTYHIGADKGGWMGSKVLRVPGSMNYKRDGIKGRVIHEGGMLFAPARLQQAIPKVRGRESIPPTDVPEPWPRDVALSKSMDLPLSLRSFLFKRNVRDRSDHIIRTINEFDRQGVDPVYIFRFIWHRPWNKFRDRPETLWQQIVG